MRPADVKARLDAGDKLHMQLRDGRRQWWFEDPRAEISDRTMAAVLNAGGVVEAGDSLFGLPFNSQTWLVSGEGEPNVPA